MPIAEIRLIEGRDPDIKARLIARVTEAIQGVLAVEAASVRVLLIEVPAANWGVAGIPKAAADRRKGPSND